MRAKTKGRVIGRDDNVVLVDFSRAPGPPPPRCPGAGALRQPRYRRLSNSGSRAKGRWYAFEQPAICA